MEFPDGKHITMFPSEFDEYSIQVGDTIRVTNSDGAYIDDGWVSFLPEGTTKIVESLPFINGAFYFNDGLGMTSYAWEKDIELVRICTRNLTDKEED